MVNYSWRRRRYGAHYEFSMHTVLIVALVEYGSTDEVTDVDETITDDSIHSARRPSWRRTPTSRDSVHVSRASCRPESFADEFDALFSSPDEAIASPAGTGRCSPLRRYLHDADRLPPGYLRRASGKSPAKGEGDGLRI